MLEQLCEENRSGGLGKSSEEVSVDEDEDEGRSERLNSGSSVGQDDKRESAWSCESGAADTQEAAAARCAGAGPPL